MTKVISSTLACPEQESLDGPQERSKDNGTSSKTSVFSRTTREINPRLTCPGEESLDGPKDLTKDKGTSAKPSRRICSEVVD